MSIVPGAAGTSRSARAFQSGFQRSEGGMRLPASVEPARGVRVREHRRRRRERDARRRRARDRVDGAAARGARDDVHRVGVGQPEHVRQVRAREHDDAARGIGRADAGEQRYEAERDVAEAAIPAECELVAPRAHRVTQRAVERRAGKPVREDPRDALHAEPAAGLQSHRRGARPFRRDAERVVRESGMRSPGKRSAPVPAKGAGRVVGVAGA